MTARRRITNHKRLIRTGEGAGKRRQCGNGEHGAASSWSLHLQRVDNPAYSLHVKFGGLNVVVAPTLPKSTCIS